MFSNLKPKDIRFRSGRNFYQNKKKSVQKTGGVQFQNRSVSEKEKICPINGRNAVQYQGCGSGSALDPDSIGSMDPDSDPGGQKLPTKAEKIKNFHVLKCWMFSFAS
jgi:hypothetical protein